jgi:phage major head subunit gpT-like protein
MAITRSQLVKELEPGLNALFGLEYKRYENEHEQIFSIETSDRAFEEEVMLTGFGQAPVKTEGAGVQYDTALESFTARYTHETVAMAFALTEEAVEDNLYDRLSGRYTKAMARSMSFTKQVKAASVLNNGFTGGNYAGGDGVALFSTAHPTALSSNYANTPAVPADLNETSLEQALIDIAAFIDERGLKVALTGRKMIVPKELQFTAERLMKSTLRTGTADNDVNAIKSMGMLPEGYSVNHYLTDVNAWFIITDAPNGLKMFERSPIKTAFEGDFDTGNVRYKARERYSFGWSDPRGAYGSPGA